MNWPRRSTFRKKANFAGAVASECIGPVIRLVDLVRRRETPVPPAKWRNALLLGAGHIGDVLYNTGSLPALAAAFPDCRWHYAAARPAAEALEGNPHLAGIVDPANLPERAGEFDVAVCYDSGGTWRNLWRAWKLGIPNRAGYVHKGFSSLVTHPIAFHPPKPHPAYFRDLVAQLAGREPDWPLRPLVYTTQENETDAERLFSDLGLSPSRPILACFLTSLQPSGIWPADRFARSVQLAHGRIDCDSVLLGAASDESLLNALVREFQLPSRVSAGALSLRSLVSFLRRCRAVLCTDSGPRHLANAAGARVFFVPNISVGSVETGSYVETETNLAPDLEWVPAARQIEAFGRIEPDEVARLVAGALS